MEYKYNPTLLQSNTIIKIKKHQYGWVLYNTVLMTFLMKFNYLHEYLVSHCAYWLVVLLSHSWSLSLSRGLVSYSYRPSRSTSCRWWWWSGCHSPHWSKGITRRKYKDLTGNSTHTQHIDKLLGPSASLLLSNHINNLCVFAEIGWVFYEYELPVDWSIWSVLEANTKLLLLSPPVNKQPTTSTIEGRCLYLPLPGQWYYGQIVGYQGHSRLFVFCRQRYLNQIVKHGIILSKINA